MLWTRPAHTFWLGNGGVGVYSPNEFDRHSEDTLTHPGAMPDVSGNIKKTQKTFFGGVVAHLGGTGRGKVMSVHK